MKIGALYFMIAQKGSQGRATHIDLVSAEIKFITSVSK